MHGPLNVKLVSMCPADCMQLLENQCYVTHILHIPTFNTSANKYTIKTKLMTSMKLLHVLASNCHLQGVF